MKKLRLILGAWLVVLISAGPLWANAQQQDPEFAQRLLQSGFPTLAEEVAENIKKSKDFLGLKYASRSRSEKAGAEYVTILLLKYRAGKAGTEEARKKILAEYEKKLKRFQKKHSDHPQALNAGLNLLLTKRQEGNRRFTKARIEPDEGEKQKKIDGGKKFFIEVIKGLAKLSKDYQQALDKIVKAEEQKMKDKAKTEVEKNSIYYDLVLAKLFRNRNRTVQQLHFRRALSEYLKGETALYYVDWQEKLEFDDNKSKYLQEAYQSFQVIEYDFSGYPSLLGRSGLGQAQVLLKQGKLPAARNKYDGFTKFNVARSKDPGPTQREKDLALTKQIRMGAYSGLAKTFIKLKEFKNAIIKIDEMLKIYPDAFTVEEGRDAMLAKVEALIVKPNPDPYEAMEEAMKIVRWARKNEENMKGRDYSRAEIVTAIKMAQIREKMTEVAEFPPDISLLIAVGFKEIGKYKWAIYAYKDVLGNTDRENLVVKSLKGMGTCYELTKRYEEAAMAFAGTLERYPDRRDAIKMAKNALAILTEQFGKEDEAVREFKKNLEDRLGGAATFYNRAIEARIQAMEFFEQKKNDKAMERLREAVEALNKVEREDPSTGNPVRYYGEAKAAIGDCYYKMYRISNSKKYLDQAMQFLNEKYKEFKERDRRGWAATSLYLGRIYVRSGNYEEAIKVLEAFNNRLKSETRYAGPAKSLVIRSAIALGKTKVAAQQFNDLKNLKGPKAPETAQAAYLLTFNYRKFVEREQAKIQNSMKTHQLLFNNSNLSDLVSAKELADSLLERNKAGKARLKVAQSQAGTYAMFLYEYYKSQNQGSFGTYNWLGTIVLESGRYPQAIEILKSALKMKPKVGKDTPKEEVEANQLRYFFAQNSLADAHFGIGKQQRNLGHLKKALAFYESLAKDEKFKRSVYTYNAIKGAAETSHLIAEIEATPASLSKAIEHYRAFRTRVYKLTQRPNQYAMVKDIDDPSVRIKFYEVSYTFFKLLYKAGNYKECHGRIESLKGQGVDFGTRELKKKYLELFELAKSKI